MVRGRVVVGLSGEGEMRLVFGRWCWWRVVVLIHGAGDAVVSGLSHVLELVEPGIGHHVR